MNELSHGYNIDTTKKLCLNYQELTNIPDEVRPLITLKRLDLRGNQITSLPEWIGELKELEYLDIIRNKLTNIPEQIGQLTKIKELWLKDNQLTSIPKSLCELIKNKEIRIWLNENKFKKVIGSRQGWTLTNHEQEYTILNNEYIYQDNLESIIFSHLVKHLTELKQEELSDLIIKQSKEDQIIMINNYQTAGVILTPKTATKILSNLTGRDYTKHTTENIYQENPEQKDMINKIINICPTLRSIIPYNKQTMTKTGTEEYQEVIL